MKYVRLFLSVLLVAAVVYVVVQKNAPSIQNDIAQNPLPAVPVSATDESCYIWNTEAGDSATLRVRYLDNGTKVTGFFNWHPAQKDRKFGPFTGVIDGDGEDGTATYTAWWRASSEGVENTEELKFSSDGEGHAAVGFGEMKEQGVGTYIYANEANITYEPWLQETTCDDPAAARE